MTLHRAASFGAAPKVATSTQFLLRLTMIDARLPRTLSALWAALVVILAAMPAAAATINVPADQATIQAALTASSNGDVINIAAGTYTEVLTVTTSVTIQGQTSSNTIVQAAVAEDTAASSAVTVGVGLTVTISNLTIRYGKAIGATATGGGIKSSGTLTLDHVALLNNRATATGGDSHGGGLHVAAGSATLQDCTLANNRAIATGTPYGGGASRAVGTDLTLIRTTISGNFSIGSFFSFGGGVADANASGDPGHMRLVNCTVSGNDTQGSLAFGGGIFNGHDSIVRVEFSTISGNHSTAMGGGVFSGSTTDNEGPRLRGCIVVGNTADSSGPDIYQYIQSSGYNIFGTTSGGTLDQAGTGTRDSFVNTSAGDQIAANPQLSALAANGGPVQTMAIASGSAARDPAVNTCTDVLGATVSTDARGYGRPSGAACDIGAYEYGATAAAVNVPATDAVGTMIMSVLLMAGAAYMLRNRWALPA